MMAARAAVMVVGCPLVGFAAMGCSWLINRVVVVGPPVVAGKEPRNQTMKPTESLEKPIGTKEPKESIWAGLEIWSHRCQKKCAGTGSLVSFSFFYTNYMNLLRNKETIFFGSILVS
jgi:hypothetical protein